MAFNPFNTFRKHQKVIFAVLTIICMFVFILQFGKGDITHLFSGAGQGKGEKVVTLYGRDLYTNDLTGISNSRQLANEFIFTALIAAQTDANKDIEDYKPENADEADKRLQVLSVGRRERYRDARGPEDLIRITRQSLTEIDALRHLSAPVDNSRRNRAFDDLSLIYRFEFFQMMLSSSPFYFGGGVKPQELLDFEIWKHQADKLGIVLTKADTRRALAHEAANHGLPADPGGSWKDEPIFKEWFAGRARQNKGPVPEDIVVKAVQDEFRVMIAKELVAGRAAGVPGVAEVEHSAPNLVTPYDFWKFYRNNRTTIKAVFLPLPVESFLDKTPSQPPSEEVLKDLFTKYKAAEPAPELSTPAFKEPHRIKLEYVVAAPDSEYYKARGLSASIDPALYYATAALGGNLAGGGVAPQAAMAATLNEDALAKDYNSYLGSGSSWLATEGRVYPFDLHDQTYLRPEVVAASVGQAFGAGLGQGSAVSAPAGYCGTIDAREAADRTRILASTFLEGTGWAVNSSPFAGFALQAPFIPAMPPAAVAMRQVFEKRQREVLRDKPQFFPGQPSTAGLVSLDLQQFTDELGKLKNKPDAEVQEFIRKTVKERGWELHDKAGLDDIYSVEDDRALADVKFAIGLFQQRQSRDSRQVFPPFANEVFGFQAGKYIPSPVLPDGRDKYLVFWRSEDERAHELDYDDARPRVLAAWRFQEARKLVLREADRISGDLSQKEADGQLSPQEAIKYFRDQKLGQVFELVDIARLKPAPSANPGSATYYRYVIPASQIPYAPADLLDQLMTLDKPGQTLVFQDLPAKKWYVAVLEERPILSFDDKNKDKGFIDAYADATIRDKDQFWRQYFEGKRQADFEEKLMRQLREEAGSVDEKGQLILSGKPRQEQQQQQGAPDNGGDSDNF
ncbi:MAG TPA: hypothetical protein DDY78_21805 [Planctomycetales bacterium]|jgi:hypothetical protein|nr:hypothetical protein [Planctomycetales bacterium]